MAHQVATIGGVALAGAMQVENRQLTFCLSILKQKHT